jgi:hypothetical protein
VMIWHDKGEGKLTLLPHKVVSWACIGGHCARTYL